MANKVNNIDYWILRTGWRWQLDGWRLNAGPEHPTASHTFSNVKFLSSKTNQGDNHTKIECWANTRCEKISV